VAVFGFARPSHWLYLSHLTRAADNMAVVHLIDFSGGARQDIDEFGDFNRVTLHIVISAETISAIQDIAIRYILGV